MKFTLRKSFKAFSLLIVLALLISLVAPSYTAFAQSNYYVRTDCMTEDEIELKIKNHGYLRNHSYSATRIFDFVDFYISENLNFSGEKRVYCLNHGMLTPPETETVSSLTYHLQSYLGSTTKNDNVYYLYKRIEGDSVKDYWLPLTKEHVAYFLALVNQGLKGNGEFGVVDKNTLYLATQFVIWHLHPDSILYDDLTEGWIGWDKAISGVGEPEWPTQLIYYGKEVPTSLNSESSPWEITNYIVKKLAETSVGALPKNLPDPQLFVKNDLDENKKYQDFIGFNSILQEVGFAKVVADSDPEQHLANAKLAVDDVTFGVQPEGSEQRVNVAQWTTELDNNQESTHSLNLTRGHTYEFYETEAPEGYENNNQKITFRILSDGRLQQQNENMQWQDVDPSQPFKLSNAGVASTTSDVVFSKVAIVGGPELEGATLQIDRLEDSEWQKVTSWESTSEAKTISLDVNQNYRLTEITAPFGYEIADEIEFSIDESGTVLINGQAQDDKTIVMVDEAVEENQKVDVEFSKVDATNSEELAGASLKLEVKENEEWKEIKTWISTNEPQTFKLIKGESYKLTETQAPYGYEIAEAIEFDVTEDGKIKIGDTTHDKIVMKDAATTGEQMVNVEFSKVDIANGEELAGANLKLEVKENEAWKEIKTWISTNEAQTFSLVKGKHYKLTETQAPYGYEIAEAIEFDVTEDGKIKIGDTAHDKIVMKDAATTGEQMVNVEFSKVDIANDEELAGATLKLEVFENGTWKEIVTWISDTQSKTFSLVKGKYYKLTETQAPYGYEIAEAIEFEVTENGAIKISDATHDKIVMKDTVINDEQKTDVEFSKVDIANGEELAGATLKLEVEENGNLKEVVTWTSTAEPQTFKLVKGKIYKLTETQAPYGYEIAEAINFRIDDNGTVAIQDGDNWTPQLDNKILMENALKKSDFIFSKKAVNGTEELVGAELKVEVRNEDGSWTEIEKWTSEATAKTLKLEHNKVYRMVETTAPDDYEVAETIVFQIKGDGKISVQQGEQWIDQDGNIIVMKDRAKKDVVFSKKAINGTEELEGAELKVEIKNEDGSWTEIEKWTSEATAKTLKLEHNEEYRMVETTAPEGYEVAEDIIFKVNDDDSISVKQGEEWVKQDGNTIVMKDRAKKDVVFSKKAVNGTEELEGAKLKVEKLKEDNTWETVAEWTSGKEAKTIKLEHGKTYRMTETQAPKGYEIAESIEFRVTEEGTIEIKQGDAWKEQDSNIITMLDKLQEESSSSESESDSESETSTGKHGTKPGPKTDHKVPHYVVRVRKPQLSEKTKTVTVSKVQETKLPATGENYQVEWRLATLLLIAAAALFMFKRR